MYNRYLYYECFTGKFTTFPIHAKLHPSTRVVYHSYSQKGGHFDIPSRFFHVCLCKPSVFYAIKISLHYGLKIYELYALNHSKIKFIYSRRRAISFNNGYPVPIVPYFYSARDAGCIGTVAWTKKLSNSSLAFLEYKIASLYVNKNF